MPDVRWADVSYYQTAVNDSYPHDVLSIRSNDGTYRDPNFGVNYSWGLSALRSGELSALIVYLVYRPNWATTAQTHMSMIGSPPPPGVVTMIDVESWGGQISGDNSDQINNMRTMLADWYGDPRRVIGYGNRGDLGALWPRRPEDLRLIVASYGGAPPSMPGMLGHQYSDSEPCDPFGPCDANIAYDMGIGEFTAALGLGIVIDEEEDMPENIPIHGKSETEGRIVLVCPTGDLAASRRQAWLSAVLVDLHDTAWIEVFAQGASGGVEQWRWSEADLTARGDNFLPRAWREIAGGVSHLIISWDVSACPEGGTLCLETKPAA